MASDFDYPVSKRALEKWKEQRLELVSEENGSRRYRFRYSGSTCNNGGTPFQAYLHAEVSGQGSSMKLEKGWIEIPEEEKEAAAQMCSAKSSSGGAEAFFARLAEPAPLAGKHIEKILTENASVNYAGCFCSPAMVRDKWNQVLSTIHFRENS